MKINSFTICLHCGCSNDVVNNQIGALKPLEENYTVYWNNRIDRHPEIYDSYSELINDSVVTSKTEWIILINDRTHPTVKEVIKMINLLESGFACVLLYNVGFMGFSKELVRKIGWWDQRFTNGGWEDRDWVFRLKQHNLALYESQESTYDMNWKSPLNIPGAVESTKFWNKKYKFTSDTIYKIIPDESYDYDLGNSRSDISDVWLSWDDSILNIFNKPGGAPSGSSIIGNRIILEHY